MTVRVAVCQLAPVLGDPGGNLDRALRAVAAAADRGARIVVLPELVTSGYVFADEAEARRAAQPADGPAVTALARAARDRGLVVCFGFPELDEEGRLRNSAVLADPGGVRAIYRKVHLWDREKEIFLAGDAPPPVVETELGRIGLVICYDLEFPEWLRLAALRGAQLVCAPVNWPAEPRPPGERPIEMVRVQASASVNRMFLAIADRTGTERGVEWVSGSLIVGPHGFPLAMADPAKGEQILVADCDLAAADDKRISPRNDVLADRRPHLYGEVAGV